MLPATIFVFFAALLGTMVFFRLWELRVGRFDLKEVAARPLAFSEAHVEHLNSRFLDLLKYTAHVLTVLVVRVLISFLFALRKEARRLATKLDQFFLQPHGLPAHGTASFFLRDIAEYKEKLRALVPPSAKEEARPIE